MDVHRCLHFQIPIDRIVDALELLRDELAVTTNLVEQNHTFCATLLRQKPHIEEDSLCVVSAFHQLAPLCLPAASALKRDSIVKKMGDVGKGVSRYNWKSYLFEEGSEQLKKRARASESHVY